MGNQFAFPEGLWYSQLGMAKQTKWRGKILKYTAIFEPAEEGGYTVFVPALPGCFSEGDTFEEANANIREAIELYLEDVPRSDLNHLYIEAESFIVPVEVKVAR